MSVRLEQKLSVDAPPDRVWAFLTDPVQVASCLPGAAITEKVDDRTYQGTITVKVGPVTTTYRGTIRFERLDRERWEAELVGQGQDVKGKGGAEMRMSSRLVPIERGTEITVVSEVAISGILAQLGRGMIESVSNQIFQQFAAAMRERLAAGPGSPDAPPAEAKPVDALGLGARAVGETVKRWLGGGPESPRA
ncbi:MAG TPA: SRPBCC family protein [Methylomirabilota bacterium]|jgi:carbon monoxide dehydrogenase subunit G|nr:SRPBCC family protein [Methylomirabilota bacterium]